MDGKISEKSSSRNNWIIEENILKVMVKLGTPIAMGEALNIVYTMVDMYWLGRVGREALASVSASWPVIWLIVSAGAGVFAAGMAIISQFWGMNDFRRATKAGGQLIILSVLFGAPLAVLGYLVSGYFISLVGVPESVIDYASDYARILALGIPFIAIYESFSAIYVASGDSITPLKMRSAGVLINVVLDPVLIFGYFGFPPLGIEGAAIATVVSQFAVAIMSLIYIAFRGVDGHIITLESLLPDINFFRDILRIGYPISALMVGEASGFLILVHVISLLGPTPLAAWGIADRVLGIFHVFIAGMLGATSTMIGQSLGAGIPQRARIIAKKMTLYGSMIMGFGLLVLIPLRYQIAAFFAPGDDELIREVADFILIMGPSIVFFTIYLASRAVARGSGHTKPVMVFGLLRLWVLRNVLAYWFAISAGLGVKGLWTGMAISNYITGSLALWWIMFGNWNRPVVRQTEKMESTASAL